MLNRRKLVVGLSAFCMAVGLVVPLVLPTWTGMMIYAVINGVSLGVYFAVDIALMSLVLPRPEAAGRDLGILAIATSAAAALSPLVAAALINGLPLLRGHLLVQHALRGPRWRRRPVRSGRSLTSWIPLDLNLSVLSQASENGLVVRYARVRMQPSDPGNATSRFRHRLSKRLISISRESADESCYVGHSQ